MRVYQSELVALCSRALLVLTGLKANTGQTFYSALEWSEVGDVDTNCVGMALIFVVLFLSN